MLLIQFLGCPAPPRLPSAPSTSPLRPAAFATLLLPLHALLASTLAFLQALARVTLLLPLLALLALPLPAPLSPAAASASDSTNENTSVVSLKKEANFPFGAKAGQNGL